ncbi:MAG: hypothetical protein KIT84_29015 [Labilithrix sp.]|nr:hypothetical protein [Labilithrix sp.]MCW5815102.1 hypothetical protein [Labilithrix sp.]
MKCLKTGAVVLLFAAPLLACGNAALRAAERGDDAKLSAEIASKHQRGKLSNEEAATLARAVAEREIAKAKDAQTALARLRDTRACSLELDDALEERMKTRDAAGAEAALTRLEGGRLGMRAAREWIDDPDDRWRAVGARTLHREEDREKRRSAIVSPNAQIRRAALRAAADAKDPGDIELLFETARVDPELMLRNEALRAISAILRGAGDGAKSRAADLAIKLRDLWTSGDDAIKEDVAVAWGLAPVFENGGREALRVALADGKGPGAIAAAGVVTRGAAKDPELAPAASALLARTIEGASRRDRMHALAVAKLEGATLEAARKAAKDDDQDIKVAALARLAETKSDGASAKEELVALGAKGNVHARHALASAGDLRVQAWIEQDLAAREPHRKTQAASALAALGRPARAAPLLVDPDPSVRTRAACTMMVASRR